MVVCLPPSSNVPLVLAKVAAELRKISTATLATNNAFFFIIDRYNKVKEWTKAE
jgi:hypothetical protein